MKATATISLYCPTMPVHRYALSKAITAAEPMVATIAFDDGTTVTVPNVVIPPTTVDLVVPSVWKVRACVGATLVGAMPTVSVSLPPQTVDFDIGQFALVARSITAPVTYQDANGNRWAGTVTWPDSKVDLFPLQAEPVTAVGELTLQ